MVTKFGMSDKLGPIRYGGESSSDEVFLGRDFSQAKNYSEGTAAIIDSEVKNIISKAYEDAKAVLNENMEKLNFVAEFLMKNEIMEEEQFVRAMEEECSFEDLEAMTAEKRERSKRENERYAKHMEELEKKREEERAKAEARSKNQNHGPYPFDVPPKDGE